MSRRFGPQETAVGGEVRTPLSDSHPPQIEPFHHLCQSAWSCPKAKTSRRLGPQATVLTGENSDPPSRSHPPRIAICLLLTRLDFPTPFSVRSESSSRR